MSVLESMLQFMHRLFVHSFSLSFFLLPMFHVLPLTSSSLSWRAGDFPFPLLLYITFLEVGAPSVKHILLPSCLRSSHIVPAHLVEHYVPIFLKIKPQKFSLSPILVDTSSSISQVRIPSWPTPFFLLVSFSDSIHFVNNATWWKTQ